LKGRPRVLTFLMKAIPVKEALPRGGRLRRLERRGLGGKDAPRRALRDALQARPGREGHLGGRLVG
jgi:hypothetical protein